MCVVCFVAVFPPSKQTSIVQNLEFFYWPVVGIQYFPWTYNLWQIFSLLAKD